MKTARIFRIVLLLSFLNVVITTAAQSIPSLRETTNMDRDERATRSREFRVLPDKTADQKISAAKELLKARATPKDREAVAVNAEDKEKFAAFLKQPRTGLFRLHDLSNCEESRRVYNIEEPCPSHVAEKGSAYSFQERDYEFKLLADIALKKSAFQIRKIETLSFLTDLGDVPLENLSLSAAGIREMAEFNPSADKKDVLAHYKIASRGFQIGKYVYKTSHRLKENSTYALRSITYRFEDLNLPIKAKRLDIIVVFRVVRSHGDGSVSILWKELQRKDAPKLVDKKSQARS